jgi:hypothetical protein
LQNGRLTHPQDIDAPLHIAAERKINCYMQQNNDNQDISVLPAILSTSTHMHGEFLRLLFLQAHRETEANFTAAGMSSQRNHSDSFVSFQARGILPVSEEQSRTRSGQSGGVTDQPQCRGLWHSSSPSARSFTRFPSSSPPSFTQSPFPPRSLVRDGQTSPHTSLSSSSLVAHVLHYPPPPTVANSFVIGTAVINTHTDQTVTTP